MRPHEGDRDLLDRGEAHGGAHVVGEHEEGAAVGAGQALERDPVEDHAHGVLADAEVQGAPVGAALPLVRLLALGDERRLAGHRRVVGLGEVGGAAPQLGQRRRRARRAPCRMPRASRGPWRRPGTPGSAFSKPSGSRAVDEAVEQVGALGVGLAPRGVRACPTPGGRPCRASSTSRACASTAGSTSKVFFGSKPSSSLVAATSSAPSAEPCDLPVPRAVRGGPGDDRVQARRGSAWSRDVLLFSSAASRASTSSM